MHTTPHSTAMRRPAAVGIAGGATIGSFAAASALSSSGDAATDEQIVAAAHSDGTSDTGATSGPRHGRPDGDGMPAEEPLTGDLADRVTAAAEAAVPGGTVERVETDAHGGPTRRTCSVPTGARSR